MENFVVSARKYRPATFATVVGQHHITSTLKNAIERGQLAHAYLFCGPRGVGKTTCARIFAKAINCLEPEGAEACNRCESCRSFNENRSLNIHELDAASNNSVDDIRALIEQVRILPQSGRYSVFIIDEVHMLSTAAFNAFLKTLEEPPAHAIFILATTEKHKILPTILSRCQIYDFNRIRVEDSVGYLRHIAGQEGVTADDESLNLIAQKADGGMRDALSMFDKAVSFCGRELRYQEVAQTLNVLDYDTYFHVTEQLLAGDFRSVLLAFDEVLTRGFSCQTFLAGLNRHLRDLLVARDPATLRLIEMTGSLLERYRTQAASCETGFLFGAMSVLTDIDNRIRQSSDQRLAVELGLMKLAGLGRKPGAEIAQTPAVPLPPLEPQPAPQHAVPPAPSAQPVSPAQPAQPAQPARPEVPPQPAQPIRTSPVPQQPAAPRPAPQPAPAPTPAPDAAAATAPASSEAPRPRTARTPLLSLTDLMAGPAAGTKPAETAPAADAGLSAEETAARLEARRADLMEAIREMRPRFVPVFERMQFADGAVCIEVPTADLRDEILRSQSELGSRMAALAGVPGAVRLTVTVNEELRATLPVKIEDRMAYLSERNAGLAELRRALDLESES